MDGFSGFVGVRLSEGGELAACAVLGEAIWVCLRAKGSGARGGELEHERVCEAERKPDCLGEGAGKHMHEDICL